MPQHSRITDGRSPGGVEQAYTLPRSLSVNSSSETSPAGAVLRLWDATPNAVRDVLALTAAVVGFVALHLLT
jgi:hypothetical protein